MREHLPLTLVSGTWHVGNMLQHSQGPTMLSLTAGRQNMREYKGPMSAAWFCLSQVICDRTHDMLTLADRNS